MKFLVIRKPRVGTPRMPTSKSIREHKEGSLNAVKPGTLDRIYAASGGGGSVAIANADSVAQFQENFANTPLFLSSEFDVRPLTDYAR